jgi:hypothetical protein
MQDHGAFPAAALPASVLRHSEAEVMPPGPRARRASTSRPGSVGKVDLEGKDLGILGKPEGPAPGCGQELEGSWSYRPARPARFWLERRPGLMISEKSAMRGLGSEGRGVAPACVRRRISVTYRRPCPALAFHAWLGSSGQAATPGRLDHIGQIPLASLYAARPTFTEARKLLQWRTGHVTGQHSADLGRLTFE